MQGGGQGGVHRLGDPDHLSEKLLAKIRTDDDHSDSAAEMMTSHSSADLHGVPLIPNSIAPLYFHSFQFKHKLYRTVHTIACPFLGAVFYLYIT